MARPRCIGWATMLRRIRRFFPGGARGGARGGVRGDRGGGKRHATLTVGLGAIRQSFTTVNENRPDEAIDLRLIEGPFKRFEAAWRLKPPSPRPCAAVYS